MIISEIRGGLGNQMFQYAFGRALSLDLGQPFNLAVPIYKRNVIKFELENIFHLETGHASDADINAVLGWQSNKFIKELLSLKIFSFLKKNP